MRAASRALSSCCILLMIIPYCVIQFSVTPYYNNGGTHYYIVPMIKKIPHSPQGERMVVSLSSLPWNGV